MILTGSVPLLLGLIGAIESLINLKTTGWSTTRLKFVVTSLGLIAIGVTLLVVVIHRS